MTTHSRCQLIGGGVKQWFRAASLVLILSSGLDWAAEKESISEYQYEFGDIQVARAWASEPKREEFSLLHALRYIEQGARAWTGSRKCVTCHTNGTYMALRPSLSHRLGEPSQEVRELFLSLLKQGTSRPGSEHELSDSQRIYIARGLAEWDANVTKKLSPETELALRQMFENQLPTGEWKASRCWPPLESSAYQEATVATLAVAVAPGWLGSLTDGRLQAGVERLKHYFQTVPPPHDYARVVLLWASAQMPGLLDEAQKAEIVEMIWRHQRPDGGWSIRTFAQPEQWGNGQRAEKLRAEPEFQNPPSDGHQTGLVLIALRKVGVSGQDPRIRQGVQWLLNNQRESGRWWTRSLNTDQFHFITYSGSLYPLVALELCDALPQKKDSE